MTAIDDRVTDLEGINTPSHDDLRNLAASKRWGQVTDAIFANVDGVKNEKKKRVIEILEKLDEGISNTSLISDLIVVFMLEIDPELRGEDASVTSVIDFFSSSADELSKYLVIELICIVFGLWTLDESNKYQKAAELLEGFLFIPTAQNFWFMVRGHTMEVSAIERRGDVMAKGIYEGAKLIENGLVNVVTPLLTKSIESVGSFAKDRIEPISGDDSDNDEEDDMAISLSNDVVNATDKFRQGSQAVAFGVRDVSTKGIIASVSKKWEENDTTANLIQDDELRALVGAAGKIGIAALGASAVIGESIFETTKEGTFSSMISSFCLCYIHNKRSLHFTPAVSQTSVKAVSELVALRHGSNAGKQIENIGEATGNVVRGITHIGTLEGQVVAKVAAKNAAKLQMNEKKSLPPASF